MIVRAKRGKAADTPILAVCGADTSPHGYLAAVAEATSLVRPKADLASATRCTERYFGTSNASADLSACAAVAARHCHAQDPDCAACPLRFHCAFAASAAARHENQSELTITDLFCGAGGLSHGFEQVGFRPRLALDNDYWSVYTYRYNRPDIEADCRVVHADIEDYLNEVDALTTTDVVAGGVPCQSFSNANQQRQEQDPRHHLFIQLFRAVDRIRPKVVLIENVSGFRHVGHLVEDYFEEHGYTAGYVVVDAWEYGIPQRRKRLFYIGYSQDHFPDARARLAGTLASVMRAKTTRRPTLADAIADLPPLEPVTRRNAPEYESPETGQALRWHSLANASEYVQAINGCRPEVMLFNHKARYNNDRDIEIFRRLNPGEDSLAPQIADLMPYASRNHIFKDKYFRLRYSEPSRTITAHMRWDCNSYIHPDQPRGLTAREAARAQSFPDDYVFTGTFQRLYQQVGNAVPPLLAAVLARSIKSHLDTAAG